jgi:hypothetical protein
MLPFLKNKKDAGLSQGVIVKTRESDKTEENQDDNYDSLESAMAELAQHLETKDWTAAAECFRDAMDMAKEPKETEESPSPHSYEASKEE